MKQNMLDMIDNTREAIESGEAVTLAIVYLDSKGNILHDHDGKKQVAALVGALEVMQHDLMTIEVKDVPNG